MNEFINDKNLYISKNALLKRGENNKFGSNIGIDDFVYCSVKLEILDYVHISSNVSIIGGENASLMMKHFSGISTGSRIICASDELKGEGLVGPIIPDQFKDNVFSKKVIFEEFTQVGANAVIMPGVTLAQGSVVGANSLVSSDTEPWSIYVGSPAKEISKREKTKMVEYSKKMGYEIPIVD